MRPTFRELCKKADLPALLLSNQVNIRYLTKIPVEGALLLVRPSSFILFADALEIEMAERGAGKGMVVQSVKTLEKTMSTLKLCGFEDDDVSVSRFKRWEKMFQKTKLVPAGGVTEYFRRSKDEDELKAILHAQSITEELLRRIPGELRPQATEKAIAWKIECWARELGADGMAFNTIVAFGKNTSRPHHRPTEKKLAKGEIVQIDLGAKYKGYCSDRSEVFFTAKKTREQDNIYKALQEAKKMAIDAIRPGASVRELDNIAIDTLKKYALEKYFTHTLGHGVGLDIHEGVSLSYRGPDEHLLEHEVVTIEPGVYIPGKFGMRLEDMVVVQ